MKPNKNKDIITLDQILEGKYGKQGEPNREKWEQAFKVFHFKSTSQHKKPSDYSKGSITENDVS